MLSFHPTFTRFPENSFFIKMQQENNFFLHSFRGRSELLSSFPVPPQIHEKEVAGPSSPYPSGSSQTLTCSTYGLPAPIVSWKWRAWSPCVQNRTQDRA